MPLQPIEDTFYIKQGNTTPALEVQLTDEDDNPINLQGSDGVLFKVYDARTGDVLFEKSATETNVSEGIVTYIWDDGDTSEAGRFRAEFVVDYGNTKEAFPNFGYKDVLVWGTNEAPVGADVDKSYPAGAGDS